MKSDTRIFHFAWKMNNKLLIVQSYGNLFHYKETWTVDPVRGVKFPFFWTSVVEYSALVDISLVASSNP